MDDLTTEEYEKVLQYMEAVSEEDFPTAVAALKQLDFNMQVRPPSSSSPSTESSRRTPRVPPPTTSTTTSATSRS